MRGIEIYRVRAEVNLFKVLWSIDLVFVWVVVVEIDSVLDAGRKTLRFSIEIDLFFFWVVDIDLISVRGIEFDSISV